MKITGTGSYLPPGRLTNFDLEKIVDTSDEWITTRTGIKSRHVVDKELNVDMCIKAADKAMAMAGLKYTDLGAIVAASVTNEWQVPSLACQIQRATGASGYAFDVSAACSGFMFALKTAQGRMMQEQKPILVLGSETLSRLMNWEDRGTCILFADGAGAVVCEEGDGIEYINLYSYPDTDHSLEIPGLNQGIKNGEEPSWSFVTMNGRDIYKFATRTVPQIIEDALQATGTAKEDIDWMVIHQANIRILKSAAQSCGIPFEKWYSNIDEVGNTSSASVPILMDEMNTKGLLKNGNKIIVAGFGGGLTAASAVMNWTCGIE